MAKLMRQSDDAEIVLEPDQLVGRSSSCSMCLPEPHVSAQHARIYWDQRGWVLKDLASRNGTYVSGTRVNGTTRLMLGADLGFGTPTQVWSLIDDSPPLPMAVNEHDRSVVIAEDDMVALPSVNDPRVTIYRASHGAWIADGAEGTRPLRPGQIIDVDGVAWRFSCPEHARSTVAVERMDLASLLLRFEVSQDEEHVQLWVEQGQGHQDIGSGAKVYLLLILARAYLTDRKQGVAEAGAGWIEPEDLFRDFPSGRPHLNVLVFRLRDKFLKVGVHDGAEIVQRRADDRRMRIGTSNIKIVTL